ncbi:MAG: hypothetical protein M0P12_00330 [Paludibacteraceae bacterium]|nr:hypothetical protein [Paludibacteraceae bacterium]MCK9615968.1 hypothetical protein [Candidatus Omnitrophota bacterium]
MYSELHTYVDEEGRTITSRKFQEATLFTGKQKVKTQDMREWDWEFGFPLEIQTIESAFERFDEICKRRLDEHNARFKK